MKKRIQPIIIIFLASIFVVSPIILNKTPVLGVDGYFHYGRIYEAAMQIKHLNFSMLNLYSFQQSGRIVNEVYSPFLTYVLGIILLLSGSWLKFQVIINILVLFIAGISAYFVSRRLHLNEKFSIALGIIYLTSNAVASFLIVTGWRSIGLAFLPLMILPIFDMLQGNFKLKNSLILALAVSIQVQGHLLSAAFAIPVLIAPFVIGFIQTHNKWLMVRYLVMSVITSIILCLNSILPYLQLSKHNILVPPTRIDVTNGIFNPFDIFSTNSVSLLGSHISISENILAILSILGITTIITFWKRISILSRILIISGLTYFVLGSNLMPWPIIQLNLPEIMNFLQFSFRFTLVGEIFVLTGALLAMKEIVNSADFNFNKLLEFTVITMSIISVISLATSVSNNVISNYRQTTTVAQSAAINPKDLRLRPIDGHPVNTTTDLRAAWSNRDLSQLINTVDRTTPDYLPITKVNNNEDYYGLYTKHVLEKHSLFNKNVRSHGILHISWSQNKAHQIEVPVFVYKNTSVYLNGKKLDATTISKTPIGTINLNGIKGKNSLTLQYKTSHIFNFMIIVSDFSWLILICYFIFMNMLVRSDKKLSQSIS
ncbi:hypothetical protein [Weissella hellenica]|uniref:hypothetical protein n=1 Tax=Weissella hellenica TaxID=46256 RepID=UPI00388A03FF